jgi:hypothetical protein
MTPVHLRLDLTGMSAREPKNPFAISPPKRFDLKGPCWEKR